MNYCECVVTKPGEQSCDCAVHPCPHQRLCDKPASVKVRGEWFCEEHAEEMSEYLKEEACAAPNYSTVNRPR